MHAMNWRIWLLGSLAAVAGCTTAVDPSSLAASANAPAEPSLVRGIVNARVTRGLPADVREKVAFKRNGSAWSAGFFGYDAAVNELGEIAFTPRRTDRELKPMRFRGGRSTRLQVRGDEARLATMSIARGEHELTQGGFAVREIGGEMIVDRGSVREVIANTDRGVETLWEFDSKPTGTDDLVVRVAVANAGFVEDNDRGLAFADTKGVGFTYGKATWVDANGVRTALTTRWTGSHIEILAPSELLETSAYPATLDPLAVPGVHPTTTTFSPAVAALGRRNFVVWESYLTNNPRLQFSFVNDSDGQIASNVFSRNVSSNTWQQDPAATGVENSFVVAWSDLRDGIENIRVARIDAATGQVTREMAVASSGTDYQYRPGINCMSETNCLVTWNEYVDGLSPSIVRTARINPMAGTVGSVQTISSTMGVDQYGASVANDGSSYYVAWQADLYQVDWEAGDNEIMGRRLTNEGVPLASPLALTTAPNAQYTASLVFDGTDFVVGYTEWNGTDEDAYALRISPAGEKLGSPISIAVGEGNQSAPSLGGNGATLLAVYTNGEYDTTDILARSFSPQLGTTGSAFPISTAANRQLLASVARGTGNFYAVYATDETGTFAVAGARADSTTAILPTAILADGPPRCDAVTLSGSPTSPQAAGTAVALNASATCTGSATAEYEFAIDSGSGFVVVRPYGTSTVLNWDTSSYASKTYQVRVRSRRVGSELDEGTQTIDYVLSAPITCKTLSAAASPLSPQQVGTTVSITANASCSDALATPEYEFYLHNGASWARVQAYSTSPTWNWNTAGLGSATYSIQIRSRRQGSSAAYEGLTSMSYALTGGPGVCNKLSVGASPTSPQAAGTNVVVTGTATCTDGATPVYQVYTLAPGGTWARRQDWASNGSYNWNTAGATNGVHYIQFRSRSAVSNAAYESLATVAYEITGGAASCGGASFTTSPVSPQPVGTPVSLTASAVCSGATPLYQAFYLPPGGYWTLLQDFSTNSVIPWNATSVAGTYHLQVRAKAQGSSNLYDSLSQKLYVIQ